MPRLFPFLEAGILICDFEEPCVFDCAIDLDEAVLVLTALERNYFDHTLDSSRILYFYL